MNKILVLTLVLLGGLGVACAAQPTAVPASPVPAQATTKKSGTLRYALLGSPSIKDVPSLMALDSLKSQGYTVETQTFGKSDVMTDALARGDLDVAAPSTNVAWTAVAKGADFRSIVAKNNMTFYLVAPMNVASCQDLKGKTLGFATRQSVGYVMFDKYMKEICPGVEPEIVLIAESQNRVVTLQANKLDGSYLELEDWLQLNQKEPGKFHALIDFGKEFPQIQYSTFSARRAWADENPELVKDFVRALLTANRQVIADPKVLQDEIVKRLKYEPAEAQELAGAYLGLGIWDANGGMTSENLKATMDFMSGAGSVPKGKTAEDVSDVSYLNAVLGEIGRK